MRITLITIVLATATMAFAQNHEFSLVSYNSLRYSPTNLDARHPDLRMILGDVQADILCVQELSGMASAQMYMDSVLNFDSATYSMATFINGNELDVALFYKTSKFTFLSTKSYPTTLRNIFHFELIPSGLMDTLHIFGLHLKASTGSANQQRRKDEIDVLRQVTDQFSDGTNFIVCGDFNIYSANEPGYARLLDDTPGNSGHFVDQFSLSGTWNNANYAMYHTQSPRSTAFNGGASSGMDDRFDMILISESLDDTLGLHYVSGSMFAYGNDGLHYDMSINDLPTNTAVGQTMADALYYASDHIPVVAKFAYHVSGVSIEENFDNKVSVSMAPHGLRIENPSNLGLKVKVYLMDGREYLSTEFSSTADLTLKPNRAYLISISELDGKYVLNRVVSF